MKKSLSKLSVAGSILCLFMFFSFTSAYGQVVRLSEGNAQYGGELNGKFLATTALPAPLQGPGILFPDGVQQSVCESSCYGNPQCVAWTYWQPSASNNDKGKCQLISEMPVHPTPCPAGEICLSGTIGEIGVLRPGGTLSTAQKTAGMCQTACYKDDKCMSWHFEKVGKGTPECYLNPQVSQPKASPLSTSGYILTETIQ